MEHYEYKIYNRKTGKLVATGDARQCAAALGVKLNTFTKIGRKIVDGEIAKLTGTRVLVNAVTHQPATTAASGSDKQSKAPSVCTKEACGDCKFYCKLDQHAGGCCMYWNNMDTMRPCKAGSECTVKVQGKRIPKSDLGSFATIDDYSWWREIPGRGR